MNATNRFLNRAVILIAGLVLVVVGAAAVAIAVVPVGTDLYSTHAPAVEKSITGALDATRIAGFTISWIIIAVIAGAVLIAALAAWFALRQGGGRTSTLVTDDDDALVIDTAVAADAISDELGQDPRLASSSVSSYVVRGTTGLKITASPRAGASTSAVRDSIDGVIHSWDDLLGQKLPVLVLITTSLGASVGSIRRTD